MKTETKETKREAMYARIKRHGESLLAAFPNATERDPVKLCKKLRRIELPTHKAMTDYCNGESNMEAADLADDKAVAAVAKLLGLDKGGIAMSGLFVNRDPRGYALKLDSDGDWLKDYQAGANRVPKCAACGNDALACSGINAHDKETQRKNINNIAEWRGRQSLRIYTDMGGYGILAPDLTED